MNTTQKSMGKVILHGIRKSLLELGSATKAELSDKLGVSFPTISKFLDNMEKNGEITAVGLDESSGGRRAKRYRYNSEYMLGLAIFLEGTETNYTVFNCKGEVKEKGKTSSVLRDADLDLLTKCIEEIMEKYPKISSIAIGVPGSVENGRIFYIPGYEHLQNYDLKGYLEKRFSKPVVIENDMNAAVLGYHSILEIQENISLIYLYSGQNGPGAGILINGDVVRGSTFFSGEVSFVPQYDHRNFREALENSKRTADSTIHQDNEVDAISRLLAAFTAIINPHVVVFSDTDITKDTLNKITESSSTYIPTQHLPKLTIGDWKQDYLYGLQSLGLELMMNEIKQ